MSVDFALPLPGKQTRRKIWEPQETYLHEDNSPRSRLGISGSLGDNYCDSRKFAIHFGDLGDSGACVHLSLPSIIYINLV